MFRFGLGERCNRRIPVTDIADRGVERVAQSGLLSQPFGMVARRSATGDDFEALFVQTLTNGGSDATHAARDIRYFLTHFLYS